jgi:hemoglobin/transferrin/lactoferrin receptor protein
MTHLEYQRQAESAPAARRGRQVASPIRHLALACALGLSGAAGAQTPPETPDGADPTWLDTIVVVASRAPEPLSQVVASVAVIDRQTLERELVQDIGDLVRYTPGVAVISEGNRFGRQGFSIRGLEGNRVRVEVDGVPMPDAFAVGQFAAAGRDLADLEAIQQVEILRGPASTLYGSDALAGIVVMRTRDPADFLAEVDGDHYLGARFGYNGRDDSALASGVWAGQLASGWQAMALVARRDGHEDENAASAPESRANPADYTRDTFLGKLLFDAGVGGRYTLTAEYSEEDRFTDVRSLLFGPGRFNTTFRLQADDGYQRQRLSLKGEWADPLPWLDALEVQAWGQDAETRQDSAQWRLPDRASRNDTLRLRQFEFEQRVAGLDVVAQSRFDALGARHWMVYGVDFERSRYEGFRDGTQTDLLTGAVTNTVLGEVLPVRDFPTSTERSIGLFWQDEIDLGGGLALIPGLRWEHYRLEPKPDALFRADFPDLPVVEVSESELTPRASLRWTVDDRHTLFAQYAEGFRAPPFSDANIALSLTGLAIELRANPDLQPETSRGIELGWRFTGDRLRASVSGFVNRYRNLIDTRANLGPDPATGALIFQSVNRDRARIRGVEGELDWLLGERWALRGALAYARGDDTRRDMPLNSVQPARAVLGLRREADRWGAEAVLTAVAAKDRVDTSAGPLFEPPGYALIDLLVWAEPWDGVRINAGLFNLADRRVWDWSSARGIDPTSDDLDFFTRPGRSASVSVTLGW